MLESSFPCCFLDIRCKIPLETPLDVSFWECSAVHMASPVLNPPKKPVSMTVCGGFFVVWWLVWVFFEEGKSLSVVYMSKIAAAFGRGKFLRFFFMRVRPR